MVKLYEMKKILVFPCGSEVAMEIHRSLKYSNHFDLIGASSVDDHGKFIFEKYIDNIPFIDSDKIIPALKEVVVQYQIDAIFPAMDKVMAVLKRHENDLGCKIICSKLETTEICLSKRKTYDLLNGIIRVPKVYDSIKEIDVYPVFFKPTIGYGSRGVFMAEDEESASHFFEQNYAAGKDIIITEYLPGREYTIDCFTDRKGKLLFSAGRKRNRIMNGISVNTTPDIEHNRKFMSLSNRINDSLDLRGAWFFQVKEDSQGDLVLLEVASRLGGSSALFRNLGVNFALLTLFDAFDYDVEVIVNNYNIELDRAFSNKYKLTVEYDEVFVDFDDCLIIKGRVNEILVAFLYQSINEKKRVILITKHAQVVEDTLKKFRLFSLFDEILHIKKEDEKCQYVKNRKAIFIDDSHDERKKMKEKANIPVFAPDMIESLLKI